MELSKFEKLALIMLSDIAEKVGATESVDPKFLREAIYSGNTWGIEWEYPGIFPNVTPKEIVTEVANILDMWSFIEEAGGEQFPGFDGNRESTHASAAEFMTDQLGRFESLKGRVRHGVLGLDGYRRMYEKFESMRGGLANRHPPRLIAPELAELLAERLHPTNR